MAAEIRRQQRNHRAEHKPTTQAHAYALAEEQLPVLRGKGRRKDAEHRQDGSDTPRQFEEACIRGAAGKCADKEEHKDLDAADPGNVRCRSGEKLAVVGLEDAKGRDIAPGIADGEVGTEDLRPGDEASVWNSPVFALRDPRSEFGVQKLAQSLMLICLPRLCHQVQGFLERGGEERIRCIK